MRFHLSSVLLSAAFLAGCAGTGDEASLAGSDIRFQAVIAEGAEPLEEPVSWVVTRLSEESGAPGEVVATPTAAAPELSLAPGRYVVAARYGDAEAREEIVVGAEGASHVIDLNAGLVRLDMIPHAGAPVITDDVTWEVYRYEKGRGVDERLRVVAATAPSRLFVLPAGYYTVRARHADSVADMVVPVSAGHHFNYTLNLYAGKVSLSAVAANGTVADDVTWRIVRATPNANGERETVAQTVGGTPKLLLREGRYIALARSGSLAGEAPFEIKAGNSQTVEVELNAVGKADS